MRSLARTLLLPCADFPQILRYSQKGQGERAQCARSTKDTYVSKPDSV